MPNEYPACKTDRSKRWVPACDYSLTLRQCYWNALKSYGTDSWGVGQHVSGVRFQFSLCGAGSTALANCQNPALTTWSQYSAWATNLRSFFGDIFLGKQYVLDPCTNPPSYTWLYFWPASPYGIGADPNDQASLGNPADASHNNAYTCSPTNPHFVGWDKIFQVFDYVLQQAAIASKPRRSTSST
jgi:hypothetical protein